MMDGCLTDATPELLHALRLAAEYIWAMPAPAGSIEADVRRMVLAKACAAIRLATGETV